MVIMMRDSIFSILLCVAVSWANQQPTIETALGTITGYHKSSFDGRTYSAFEGIPYAKPPVGDLRFEEPQPADPWSGVLNANTSSACFQIGIDFITTTAGGQEDCLYLNVYVPKEQPSESDTFDVLVHIHGGAFMMGQGAMAGPSYIMDRNIVYVNMNYRLGLFGFLSTEDEVVPGNNGLKDQQLALKWVQANIKRFGGNPNSVTIIGLSAGGASVHFHYFSPMSKGLFHRGISSSGTALAPWAIQEGALEKTKKLGVLAGCHDSKIQNIIDCLKKVPGQELIAKTTNYYEFANIPLAPFAPVVEKKSKKPFLSENPYQLLQRGEINDVPWITSITANEGIVPTVFIERRLDEINQNWNALLPILLDYTDTAAESRKTDIADKIKEYYFDNQELSSENIDSLVQLFGDRYFNIAFETAIQMHAKVSKYPIYAYIYNFATDHGMQKLFGSNLKGVSHGADGIIYDMKMPGFEVTLSPTDVLMKDILIDLIISFATDGNPQVKGINWKPMTNEKFTYLHINNIDEIIVFENNEITPRKFWESLDIMEYGQQKIKEEL